MINIDNVLKSVKDGMKNASSISQLLNFTNGGIIKTEYIATVKIGEELIKNEISQLHDYKIIFECPTKKFIRSLHEPFKSKNPYSRTIKTIFRNNLANSIRNGRVDIAILSNKGLFDRGVCAIEVKGNAPSKRSLELDILRNVEFINHTDSTSESSMAIGICCAFESFNHDSLKKKKEHLVAINRCDEKRLISSTSSKYENIVGVILNSIDNIKYKIDVFTTTSDLLDNGETQEDYESNQDNLHLTLGIMITLEKKQLC